MIISASRRTDIPAFFSDWLMNRIKEGFVLVRNPMNSRQISRVRLDRDVVDCFVFWTKNPQKMLARLSELDEMGYKYYFQFTLNPYSHEIEKSLPPKKEVIDTFKTLSQKIGKDRLIWRYDPILYTDIIDNAYHLEHFEYLSRQLKDSTNKCVISFIDFYKKSRRNLEPVNPLQIDDEQKRSLVDAISKLAAESNLTLEMCAEKLDFSEIGIKNGRCIDDKLVESISGGRITVEKDIHQRDSCGCVTSIDIGSYNSCWHNCLYCYANFNQKTVRKNNSLHNPDSPFLYGNFGENDKITDRKMVSILDSQLSIL